MRILTIDRAGSKNALDATVVADLTGDDERARVVPEAAEGGS